MNAPSTVSEADLRQVHRDLDEPISFEAMARSPALAICLRNLAEIRKRQQRSAAPAARPPAPVADGRMPTRHRDGKRAAANDLDD